MNKYYDSISILSPNMKVDLKVDIRFSTDHLLGINSLSTVYQKLLINKLLTCFESTIFKLNGTAIGKF